MRLILSIKNFILDVLMVLACTVASMSFVGFITIDFAVLPANLNWLVFVVSCYIFRFGFSIPNLNVMSKQVLMKLFLVLLLWEAFQAVLFLHSIAATYFVEAICYVFFFSYFFKASDYYSNINKVIKPYCWFYVYSAMLIILTATLILMGILSPTDNKIEENRLLLSNMDSGIVYFWPGHLSIVTAGERIGTSVGLPVLCGLSHEPHVLGNSIFPAFFLLLYYLNDKAVLKVLAFISLILVFLLSFSTTSFICLSIVFLIDFFIYGYKNTNKAKLIGFLLLLIILVFYLESKYEVFSLVMNESSKKMNDTGSKGYTTNLLLYLVTPSNIIGDGIYPRNPELFFKGNFNNVGLISALIILSYYFVYLRMSVNSLLSKNKVCHFIGLASMYFFFHSLKSGCMIFNYPIIFYMSFLLSYSNCLRKGALYKISKSYGK